MRGGEEAFVPSLLALRVLATLAAVGKIYDYMLLQSTWRRIPKVRRYKKYFEWNSAETMPGTLSNYSSAGD